MKRDFIAEQENYIIDLATAAALSYAHISSTADTERHERIIRKIIDHGIAHGDQNAAKLLELMSLGVRRTDSTYPNISAQIDELKSEVLFNFMSDNYYFYNKTHDEWRRNYTIMPLDEAMLRLCSEFFYLKAGGFERSDRYKKINIALDAIMSRHFPAGTTIPTALAELGFVLIDKTFGDVAYKGITLKELT